MNLFTALFHTLRSDPWRAFPFAAIAGTGLLTLRLPPAVHGTVSLYLLQAAAFFMLYLSSSAATRLALTAQTLTQRRVPVALWKDSVTVRLAATWANGAALLAALAVSWILGADAHPTLLAGTATLSLAACAGTLFSTMRSGLLHRVSNRTVYVAALVGLVVFFSYGHAGLAALARLPVPALLLAAAGWPAMAVALRRHWRAMPRLQPAAQTKALPAWAASATRYTFLQPTFRHIDQLQSSVLGGLRAGTASLCFGIMKPIALGGTLTAGHLLVPVAWIPMAMGIVVMRDLHWRTLLAPASRQSLAVQIYRTSMKLAALLLLVLAAGQALADMALGSNAADSLMGMEKWAVFAMQAPLLVAVSVLLCALPNPRVTMWGTFIVAYIALAITHVGKLYDMPIEGLHADAYYVSGVVLLSGLAVLAADRLWTPRRLLPYLPERPAATAAFSAAR